MAETPLQVAVGVISDANGNILITQRAKHAHQGGLWEFPGGKLEANETSLQALSRELQEEVGISVQSARPLIKIHHQYPDLAVLLDVWQVESFRGTARACEGQALRWVAARQLNTYQFPAANLPIINATQLPRQYAILEAANPEQVFSNLETILANQVRLIQLRVKSLPIAELAAVYAQVLQRCQQQSVILLVNSDLALDVNLAQGLHLTSRALMQLSSKPQSPGWVAASCHNLAELQQAQRLGIDFVVLAPVLPTATHPHAQPLGWQQLAGLIEQVNLPVFALGGLRAVDEQQVLAAGAQGIAGISAFLAQSE